MENVFIVDHPLILHKLTFIRDIYTGNKQFRELVEEISMLMAFEVTRDVKLTEKTIKTPLEEMKGYKVSGKDIAVIPILRAGIGMCNGIMKLIPSAKIGHLGMYRDPETLKPVSYYAKLPSDIDERYTIIVDPMLATGGSVSAATEYLKERGVTQLKLMVLLAAPEGIKEYQKKHSDVPIYVAAIDRQLNDHGYILPGLGDAGDRLFGTK